MTNHAFEQEQLLEEGEFDYIKVRKHWIVYVEDFFLHAFGCVIFIIAAYYLASKGSFDGLLGSGGTYGAMILVGFTLIFWASFFYAWTKNYFDMWHVTNEHIIAINQKEILAREEMFMELTRIQDVLFEKNGLLASILGYGRLRVQSAGTSQEFVLEHTAYVEDVARTIMELRDKTQER